LFDMKSWKIGLSFPEWEEGSVVLGKTIRIHSSWTKELMQLMRIDWIGDLSKYCSVSEIIKTPVGCKYRIVSRIQPTMSKSKLRRLILRGSIKKIDIKLYKIKNLSNGISNPYLEMISGSNGNLYRRYIKFSELLDSPTEGVFDQFGLSKNATVPWF
jgi:CRISPR-associated endonuclease Csy4